MVLHDENAEVFDYGKEPMYSQTSNLEVIEMVRRGRCVEGCIDQST
jgi:hypothetical protein